jgi:membrane peptidoglycan carboxypeptidase
MWEARAAWQAVRKQWSAGSDRGLRKGHAARDRLPRSRWFIIALLPTALAAGILETQTSLLQAQVFTAISRKLSYVVSAGPSASIIFPSAGPFNDARGYSGIPSFSRKLAEEGFHIVAQSVFSESLMRLMRWGITPPYREPSTAGLVVQSADGSVLYDARAPERVFTSFEQIPPPIIDALLLIENRELADSSSATLNPVVDWGRTAQAVVRYTGRRLGLPLGLEGGSTLATQIEKFRYANEGRTRSATDKLRQMLSASVRVYHAGPDTRRQRHEIILDYLNSAPLSAAAGFGEIYGIGEGLHAWFGMELGWVRSVMNETSPQFERERAFRHVLTLLCATRAPSYYLLQNRTALKERVDSYIRRLQDAGIISSSFAEGVLNQPVTFLRRAPAAQPPPWPQRKESNAIRRNLLALLGLDDAYTLDRLNLAVQTTLDEDLQKEVLALFEQLRQPDFIAANGLRQRQLLMHGDPEGITYSFTLFERTAAGNALRVHADTLNGPFDVNEGMKLELGSTAKLRTLAHYLELVADLHQQWTRLNETDRASRTGSMPDPISAWVFDTLRAEPEMTLEELLDRALQRQYSGSPNEVFFTGGGAHVFSNFEPGENNATYTLDTALQHSVNLVYIRLMRDLVRFHQARLDYNADDVMSGANPELRQKMLEEIAGEEAVLFLRRAYENYRGLSENEIVDRVLGSSQSARRLSMLHLSWNPGADEEHLASWVSSYGHPEVDAARMIRAYSPQRLSIEDFGYLLSRHPLDIWCAGQIVRDADVTWEALLARSESVRKSSSQWLFRTRNRRPQDLRLRRRIEEDAFDRMLPYWQRLGFPFKRLVPSLSTAIGSSSDRPIALAELMGIILNDGVRQPMVKITRLKFAAGTPYETQFQRQPLRPEQVMHPLVARALNKTLASVVEGGTASRLRNAFAPVDGRKVVTGGKTGSGDNRYKTFGARRDLTSARALSRTGTFAFFIGDRYFGVVTAYVAGRAAGDYSFTSSLPVTILKLLAPTLQSHLEAGEKVQSEGPL